MRKKERIKFLFVVPGIAWVLVFTIFPLLYSLRLSFFHARLTGPQFFIWFQNYGQAFGDYRFWAVLQTTVFFVVFDVTLTVVLGLLLAMIFSRPLRKALKGNRFFRSLFTMPMFVAPIALGYLGLTIFHEDVGAVNTVLKALGVLHAPQWFSNIWLARLAISIVDIWQWTPFCFLVCLAGLQSLPEEVYEAAVLDTSSGWQMFRRITLPRIGWALLTGVLLCNARAMGEFGAVSVVSGHIRGATNTMPLHIEILYNEYNLPAAFAMAALLAMLAIATIGLRLILEWQGRRAADLGQQAKWVHA